MIKLMSFILLNSLAVCALSWPSASYAGPVDDVKEMIGVTWVTLDGLWKEHGATVENIRHDFAAKSDYEKEIANSEIQNETNRLVGVQEPVILTSLLGKMRSRIISTKMSRAEAEEVWDYFLKVMSVPVGHQFISSLWPTFFDRPNFNQFYRYVQTGNGDLIMVTGASQCRLMLEN